MKFIIKLILLIGIVVFALVNYRILSFEKGFSKGNMDDKSITEVVSTLTNIEKVEYYEKTIKGKEDHYNVYVVSKEDAFLFSCTKDEVDALNVLGIFAGSLKPEKVTPIPFYVEIVVGLLIIFIPFGKKSKN